MIKMLNFTTYILLQFFKDELMLEEGGLLIQYDCCPRKKPLFEDTEYRKNTGSEKGGKVWSDAVTSLGTPGATRSWKRPGRILP